MVVDVLFLLLLSVWRVVCTCVFRLLINNIIYRIETETKKKYKIIFTGGYANLFKTSINRTFNIDKNITIKGIIEIFKVNKKRLI